MPSSRSYLDFVLEQLSDLSPEITFRPMMGEYILYYKGKIFGGIYDDRLLVKPVKSAAAMMPHAVKELPYAGGTPSFPVENIDNATFLCELVKAMYEELPAPKGKRENESEREDVGDWKPKKIFEKSQNIIKNTRGGYNDYPKQSDHIRLRSFRSDISIH